MNAEHQAELICGLRKIGRFLGKSPSTLTLEIARGEWPIVTLGSGTYVANPRALKAAQAAREAARARGSKQVRVARELEEAAM
jgi:IS30 family transposase